MMWEGFDGSSSIFSRSLRMNTATTPVFPWWPYPHTESSICCLVKTVFGRWASSRRMSNSLAVRSSLSPRAHAWICYSILNYF